MAIDQKKGPEGLTRLPEEYQKTNDGIERLFTLFAKTDSETKKQIAAMSKQYHKDITAIVKEQNKTQKEVANYIVELRKAGASDDEIAAYLKKNVKLKTGEQELSKTMKAMQENLDAMAGKINFKTDEDKKLAEKQAKTLEKYFKDKDKKKPQTWAENKAKAAKEETGGAFKDSLVKGMGVGLQTLLGPLRLIVDPILKLGGADSISLFDKIIEKSRDSETARRNEEIDRFDNLNDVYAEEDERKKQKRTVKKQNREADTEDFLKDSQEDQEDEEPISKKKSRSTKKEKAADIGLLPVRMPMQKQNGEDTENFLKEDSVPGIFDTGKESDENELDDFMMNVLQPTRSNLLKRGGLIGAAAVFLSEALSYDKMSGVNEASSKEKGGLNFFGMPGGVKGMISKLLPVLKVAVPFAVAAAGVALVAGGLHLQKRDTQDAKKYADDGKYGRAAETFILGDRERLTEENANSELGRAVAKNTMMVGGAGLAVAGGAGIAAMGSTVAAGGGIAAMGGLGAAAGAAGTAGLAAVGAALPPVLVAAAVTAAVVAVAKGTQEAYELEYDKNAASIQKELNRVLMDEEAPFLKRVGAGFKSDWRAFTSTLAGGIRGVTDVIDVETERAFQNQLAILKKEADEGNAQSARLYEIMSQQSFREMNKKERERLLRSEGLYGEYVDTVNKSEDNFWEKLKKAAKAGLNGMKGLANTANENLKGQMTAAWEKNVLDGMDNALREDPGKVEKLKDTEVYQKVLEESGDKLKAMQEAFLDEERQLGMASGDLDMNGMVVNIFDKIKLGFKSFTDISDEAIKQSTEFDTRRLQLLAEGKSAEEADQIAMEEQRNLLTSQMELRLKQTKEYKKAFDDALAQNKSLKEAEKAALEKLKGNKNLLKSFGEKISEGLSSIWETAKKTIPGMDAAASFASNARDRVEAFGSSLVNRVTGGRSDTPAPDTSIHDGIVYKDGKVIRIDDDDNVIATKSDPFIGDKETRQADAVPVMPSITNNWSDKNIVEVLEKLLAALNKKDFSPIINANSNNAGMNFDALRTAGSVL